MLCHRLFPQLRDLRWELVNLDALARVDFPGPGRTREVNPLNDPLACYQWIDRVHGRLRIDYSYGGYLEDRSHLWRGHYLEQLGYFTHLGVDYNVHADTEVHAVRRLRVHSTSKFEDQDGGWGGQIIFKVPDGDLFVIYAHLNPEVLPDTGREFSEGEKVGVVGTSAVNGGWFPHLHVQCVRGELPDQLDGYASLSDELRERYPDPEIVL